jgi:7-cyano-7-deazaguanine synthase
MSKSELIRRAGAFPLGISFSCIAPRDNRHCGSCNKCAERQAAFAAAQIHDPTVYAVSSAA